MEDETVWLSLSQMAELFQRDKSVISKHIKNIFEEGELKSEATVAKSATVQTEGDKQVARDIEFYNLDAIISVGYRVKSHRGTQFRIWATLRLREYIVKGFAMDDERLKRCRPRRALSMPVSGERKTVRILKYPQEIEWETTASLSSTARTRAAMSRAPSEGRP